jgi:hypothetical protein
LHFIWKTLLTKSGRIMEAVGDIKTSQGAQSVNIADEQAVSKNRLLAGFFTVCFILAPLLTGLASFDLGELKTYPSYGGVLNTYGLTICIGSILGMAWLLWQRAPRFSLIVASLGIIGCVGGSNFVLAAMFRTRLLEAGVDQNLLWFTGSNMELSGLLVSAAMGLWFPVSIIIFGIGLMRYKVVPVWLGVLISVAGICFPAGRVPGDPIFTHAADALLIIAMTVLGLKYMRTAK